MQRTRRAVQLQRRDQLSAGLGKRCFICVQNKPRNQLFIGPNCTHSFCYRCIRKYITDKLKENITAVNCPDPNCDGIITPGDCKGIVLNASLSRWKTAIAMKLCSICAETKPRNEFFIGPNCTHSFCNGCIRKFVTSKIEENITAVNCPATDCDGAISPDDCKGVVATQVVDRWEMAIVESMTLISETTLYCPFKDCSSLLINDKAIGGSVECPSCHRLFCTECKVGWHADLDCAEYQKLGNGDRNDEDLLAVKLAKEKQWRRCPRCSFYIDKISGCLHITCRCAYEFCYLCGSKWSDDYGHGACA